MEKIMLDINLSGTKVVEVPYFSNQIDDILSYQKCDVFFAIKGGKYDGIISNEIKNFICAVSSNCTKDDIHGDIFAMGSDWLSKITGIPSVPHIVYLPDHNLDMRDELGIPKDALVSAVGLTKSTTT